LYNNRILNISEFLVRVKFRITRNDILLLLASGPTLRRTIFTVVCLITLIGSSFRPMPGPSFAKGSIDSASLDLSTESSAVEEEDRGLYYSVYQVAKGDTVSDIADSFDITVDTILSANNIQSARSLQPGMLLKIPSMAGIVYTAKTGDTVEAVAKKYEISADRLIETNGLLATNLDSGKALFLPDAKLPTAVLREIAGDLFKWPVRGVITSWFSWRRDPFSGRNTFHNGLDIGVPMGTPIGAAMEGRVSETGYSPIMGKYVILQHSGGWKTLYAHMSSILVQEGQYVSRSGRIGLSGNTGYSTGPHVHFTVYKNGKLINPANVLQ
ncbi:MAG TPA: M23 family metallopeptidase, partial [Rectinemataceae bacterium]|nr:M23 family metallopeptidase [Rectinemataceae bacterium]